MDKFKVDTCWTGHDVDCTNHPWIFRIVKIEGTTATLEWIGTLSSSSIFSVPWDLSSVSIWTELCELRPITDDQYRCLKAIWVKT